MIWLLVAVLVVALGCSVWLNVITIKKNLVLSDQREVLVDQIEEALDTFEDCYQRLAHNAEIPVLSDEPIVREVISDIKRAKHAILKVAGKVVTYGTEGDVSRGEDE